MPPAFQHITFAQCCDMAEEVRKKYWRSQSIPVDIDSIIEFGVELTIIPMDGLRDDIDIYGFLSNDRTTIYVDSEMMTAPKFEAALRFTMAHELGHYFLHQDFYESNKITTVKEWQALLSQIDGANLASYEDQADEFAGRLLVPLEQLKSELLLLAPTLAEIKTKNASKLEELGIAKRVFGIFTAEILAPKFNVPSDVMLLRFEREQINPLDYANQYLVQRN